MSQFERDDHYRVQNGTERLTPAQRRRSTKKFRHALAKAQNKG